MKKNNIILISLIIVVLTALCTIAGTYAVIINVTNENGTDKIINKNPEVYYGKYHWKQQRLIVNAASDKKVSHNILPEPNTI